MSYGGYVSGKGGNRGQASMVMAVVLVLFCASCTTVSTGQDAAPAAKSVVADGGGSVNPARLNRQAYPSDSNTGPVGDLAPYAGPLTISEPGTVIENVEITAPQLRVAANDVTFRNVRFVYSGARDEKYTMIAIDPRFRGTLLENCEIDGRDGTARGITGTAGVTIRGCNIHNTGNGVEVQEDFVVENSFIHNIFTPPGLGWHADGIQARDSGVQNIRITNNTVLLSSDETSAIRVFSKNGLTRNVLVSDNLLGGGGYTLYMGAERQEGFAVVNNAFTTEVFPKVGRWGAWYPNGRLADAQGNFLLGSGTPVPQG